MGGLAFLAPALPAIIGGAASLVGSLFQNSAASANAQQAEQFSAQQSNTAYQRATADMLKAGINPIMAYSQGGASSASGVVANVQNVGEAAVQGAQSAASAYQTAKQTDPAVALTKAQTQAQLASAAANVAQAQTTSALRAPQVAKAVADADTAGSNAAVARADASVELPKATVESGFYRSDEGRALHTLNMGAQSVSGVTSAVKAAGEAAAAF